MISNRGCSVWNRLYVVKTHPVLIHDIIVTVIPRSVSACSFIFETNMLSKTQASPVKTFLLVLITAKLSDSLWEHLWKSTFASTLHDHVKSVIRFNLCDFSGRGKYISPCYVLILCIRFNHTWHHVKKIGSHALYAICEKCLKCKRMKISHVNDAIVFLSHVNVVWVFCRGSNTSYYGLFFFVLVLQNVDLGYSVYFISNPSKIFIQQ